MTTRLRCCASATGDLRRERISTRSPDANAAFRSMLSVPDGGSAPPGRGLRCAARPRPNRLPSTWTRPRPATARPRWHCVGLVRTGVTTAAYNVRLVQAIRVTSTEAARAARDRAERDRRGRRPRSRRDQGGRGVPRPAPGPLDVAVHGAVVLPAQHHAGHGHLDLDRGRCRGRGSRRDRRPGPGGDRRVLLYASFGFDCMDGTLARYGGRTSQWGGWLDMIADRAKEYLLFAGFAIGGIRMREKNMWALAIAAMVLQTIRHTVDTWYGALQDTATRALPEVPLGLPAGPLGACAPPTGRAPGAWAASSGQLSASAHGRYRSPAYWLKRSVVLPIGDRWLLIAISAGAVRSTVDVHHLAGRGLARIRLRVRRPDASGPVDEGLGDTAVRRRRAARRWCDRPAGRAYRDQGAAAARGGSGGDPEPGRTRPADHRARPARLVRSGGHGGGAAGRARLRRRRTPVRSTG